MVRIAKPANRIQKIQLFFNSTDARGCKIISAGEVWRKGRGVEVPCEE